MSHLIKPFVTTFERKDEIDDLILHFERANILLKPTYIGFGKAEIEGFFPSKDLHYYLFSYDHKPNPTYISSTGQRLIKKYKKMIAHNGGRVEP